MATTIIFGDTIAMLRETGATLISTPELCGYVASLASEAKTQPMNIGGSAKSGAISLSMVRAYHSSSYAALAFNRWFDFKTVIPCHYGAFPVLVQTPEAFKAKVTKGAVWAPAPMGSREF
jgi:L-ascorbate metabolism protein UlaG (beta-lactamase superfamily)